MSKLLGISAVVVTLALTGCGAIREAAVSINGSISLSPTPVTLVPNQSAQLTARRTLDGNSGIDDVTQSAVWESSSNANLPVLDGAIVCKQAGNYTVSASVSGLKGSTPISCQAPVVPAPAPPVTAPSPTPAPPSPSAPATPVTAPSPTPVPPSPSAPATPTAPVLSSISILNPPSLVRSNAPLLLNVQGTYSDKSTGDISKQVTWRGDGVARVSAAGLLYCNVPGVAHITATVESLTSSAQVNCLLKSVTAAPGFVEHAARFYGPFASWLDAKAVYGVKGDGTTDDSQALQLAVNGAAAQHKTLWVPEGTYVISTTLRSLGADNVSIVGSGSKTRIMWKGPADHSAMVSFEGSSHFRFDRITLDGNGVAQVGIYLNFIQDGVQLYPTFDSLEDLQIANVTDGILVDYAGETTINRVHFDHVTNGVRAINWNALNLNVTESLFTNFAVGVTNEPGAGAFNVSNCVFVGATQADMRMGNAQAFSVRHNLSINSQQFFYAGPLNSGAAVTIEGNVVRSTKGVPIVYGNQGTVMLVDNSFESPADAQGPILLAANWLPTYVFALGNQYSTSAPYQAQSGSRISVISIDEAPLANVPASKWQAPKEVYMPPTSTLPVVEVQRTGSDTIQNAINQGIQMASTSAGAVVHIPNGYIYLNTTIDVPSTPGLVIVGDGQNTNLLVGSMLTGPVIRTHGSIEMENLVVWGSNNNPSVESLVEDQPSTTVSCDTCTTVDVGTSVVVEGLDHALISMRTTTLNGDHGLKLWGGKNQAEGKQTLGRFDAFMSTSDAYTITNGGHFLLSDGWHDGNQGPVQAQVSAGSVVTQEGGAICAKSPTAVQAVGFTGQLSIVGVSVNTTITADSTSTGTLGLIGSLTGVVGNELNIVGSGVKVVHGGDMYNSTNVSEVVPIRNSGVNPADVERVLAQARTEFVTPREVMSASADFVRLHRIMFARGVVGISFSSSKTTASVATYTISAPAGSNVPSPCEAGSLALGGTWTLKAGGDGYYGLTRDGIYLTNTITSGDSAGVLETASSMTDAGQRWLIQPSGNGSFHIINRADGNMVARSPSGCATMGIPSEDASQEWAVAAK